MLVALEAQTRHAVRAIEDGAFLLTMAWMGDDPSARNAERAATPARGVRSPQITASAK